MIEHLMILTTIGLLDSTSIIPLCIVFLVVLLAGPKPVVRSFGLIFGIFLVYYACGLLILLGLQSVLDEIDAYVERLWTAPETEELILQILLGILLVAFGLRITRNRKSRAENSITAAMTLSQAFLGGAGLTIVGLPGAVPYFAAIDLTLRIELSLLQQIAFLGYYNLVFVAPLAAIIGLKVLLGARSEAILGRIKGFFDRWGQRVIVALLVGLGTVLVLDGIGWFLGYPLIPV